MPETFSFLKERSAINDLLVRHHKATAARDLEGLKAVFTDYGFFVGTDDSEQWPIRQYLAELEKSEFGWDLTDCHYRRVLAVPEHPDVATFFENIRVAKYGIWRGSGTVVKEDDGWKIFIYILSFSVSNHVAENQAFRALLAQKS